MKSRKKFFKKVNAEKAQNDRITALEKRVAELECQLAEHQHFHWPSWIQPLYLPPTCPTGNDGTGLKPFSQQIWCSTSSSPAEYPKSE